MARKIIKIILLISFILISSPVKAATVLFEQPYDNLPPGNSFEVSLYVDTGTEEINALEGTLIYPPELLQLEAIRNSNSIISFWITSPQEKKVGEVDFAGIIPGGYVGSRGLLFSVIFRGLSAGQAQLNLESIKVLLNDGQGTATAVNIRQQNISLSNDFPIPGPLVKQINDQQPPENFTPLITKIAEIAGDQYILVFVAQDKGSGIDHYEIQEANDKFVTAASPYVLKYQTLDRAIKVKAVDKAGNERVVSLPAQNQPAEPDYKNYQIFVIITVLLFSLLIFRILAKKQKN